MIFACNDCGEGFDHPEIRIDREVIDYGIGSRWVLHPARPLVRWGHRG